MGANAQTAVPVFTAGEVLTAAQMKQINTGIPVFATTTTRDAAFGGTGEKTLAQGQYAYIEATSTLQVYTGSAWISASDAKLGQVVQGTLDTTFSSNSTSFISVGLTATITPTSTSSKVLVMYAGTQSSPSNQDHFSTVFRGTTAGTNLGNTNGFVQQYSFASGNLISSVSGIILDSPATVSAQIYTVAMRISSGTAASWCPSSTRSTLTLIEVLP